MLSKINPLQPRVMSFAEGGEVDSLLQPPTMEDDIVYDTDKELTPMDAMAEILGEESHQELINAAEAYPVVWDVVRMAIETGDGMVSGVGGGTDDMVPARLSDGEFVIPAGLVAEIGEQNLQSMLDDYHRRAGSIAV